MADAAELSPSGTLAQRTREAAGKTQQTTSGLPTLADDRTDWKFSYWNTAAVTQGQLLYFHMCGID